MPGYGSAEHGVTAARAMFSALDMTAGELNTFLAKYPLFTVAVLLGVWTLAKPVLQAALTAGDVTSKQVNDVRSAVASLL